MQCGGWWYDIIDVTDCPTVCEHENRNENENKKGLDKERKNLQHADGWKNPKMSRWEGRNESSNTNIE